ncbi:MAG: serine acetyltransferase [Planctomycetes bacterium]|nr:serine acetyltransferase [Planctomycetota bacterium]
MFQDLREDWRTYERDPWRPGFWAMVVYRYGRWRYRIRPRFLRPPFSFLYRVLYFWARLLLGIEIPCEAKLGRRVRVDHHGGVVVSGDAVLGDDVILRNGVTIGLKTTGVRGAPRIGSRVDIGAGAKILGPIEIGDDVAIGANAVVLQDVPPGCLAVGVPARILRRTQPCARVEQRDLQEA